MGSVYLARERLLERLVAIKVLRSALVHGDARERFIREARTAAKLTHPHIVPPYSFGPAGDTLCHLMGLRAGEARAGLPNTPRPLPPAPGRGARSPSHPPLPESDRPPRRFRATANVSWASWRSDP